MKNIKKTLFKGLAGTMVAIACLTSLEIADNAVNNGKVSSNTLERKAIGCLTSNTIERKAVGCLTSNTPATRAVDKGELV
ncbi:MAG: hypothetical protein ACRC2K_13790 [Clostridium sp.]